MAKRLSFPGSDGVGYVTEDVESELSRYYGYFTDGLAYDRIVYGIENRGRPDTILDANWTALCHLKGRGRRLVTKEKIVGRELAGLADIPDDANLFATDAHDDAVAALIEDLARYDGMALANSTKLLHQKRPGLIPILDSFAREAMGITDGTDPASVRNALGRVRAAENDPRNRAALDTALAWVRAGKTEVGDRPVTRLRVLDILAWSTIERHRGL